MSSGFVSGGTTDQPVERSDEWLAAQQEIEANIRRKQDEKAAANDGRSLYEILEANKAAKQEAFEESTRLKNQFRALDEDEVDFLDSVMESTRREEERVKRETQEGLDAFRKQQEEADKKLRAAGVGIDADAEAESRGEGEQWAAGGRKRKRKGEKEVLKGVKLRKSSSTVEQAKVTEKSTGEASSAKDTSVERDSKSPQVAKAAGEDQKKQEDASKEEKPASKADTSAGPTPTKEKPSSKGGLGLVDYGSDDDDE